MSYGDEQLLEMVLVKRHLVNVAKDAPIDEVADKACHPGDSFALYLVKGQLDVAFGDLLGGEMLSTIDRVGSAGLSGSA